MLLLIRSILALFAFLGLATRFVAPRFALSLGVSFGHPLCSPILEVGRHRQGSMSIFDDNETKC